MKKSKILVESGSCFYGKDESILHLRWECSLVSTMLFSIIGMRWEVWDCTSRTDLVRNLLNWDHIFSNKFPNFLLPCLVIWDLIWFICNKMRIEQNDDI